jgi:fructose-bisphosphate aldolase class I
MDGEHTIERAAQVTSDVLDALYEALYVQRVRLEGTLLKPNMVLSGYGCSAQASVQEVAEATVRCFRNNVPAAVPGIVFLSGGQSDEDATAHLNAMNQLGPLPWQLSFSYGRALQAPALKAWKGATANVDAGAAAFIHRAKCNSAARSGSYTSEMEKAGS